MGAGARLRQKVQICFADELACGRSESVSAEQAIVHERTDDYTEKEGKMIDVTKLDGTKTLINQDFIETVETTPDTVITLTTGKKIIVKESRQ